jgi:hypothetical protein
MYLTLVASINFAPLEATDVENIIGLLERATTSPIKIDWLAPREACDLFIETEFSPDAIVSIAQSALGDKAIDAVCTPSTNRQSFRGHNKFGYRGK